MWSSDKESTCPKVRGKINIKEAPAHYTTCLFIQKESYRNILTTSVKPEGGGNVLLRSDVWKQSHAETLCMATLGRQSYKRCRGTQHTWTIKEAKGKMSKNTIKKHKRRQGATAYFPTGPQTPCNWKYVDKFCPHIPRKSKVNLPSTFEKAMDIGRECVCGETIPAEVLM